MKHRQHVTLLVLALLAGGQVMAETPPAPPAPMPPVVVPSVAPGGTPSSEEVTLESPVRQLLINPYGEIDGLMLDNRQIVKFPPHMSATLAQNVSVGTPVKVVGFRESETALRGSAVVNQKTGKIIVERPPQPGEPAPVPPHLRTAQLQNLQLEGKVQAVLSGPAGDINGVVLENGGVVRFAPMALNQPMTIGKYIVASGVGTRNSYGVAIEALRMGDSAQSLQNVSAAP
jgi:hypothetical protein